MTYLKETQARTHAILKEDWKLTQQASEILKHWWTPFNSTKLLSFNSPADDGNMASRIRSYILLMSPHFRLLFVYFEKIIDSQDMEFNEYSYANRRKGTLLKNIEGIIVSISAFVLVSFRSKL